MKYTPLLFNLFAVFFSVSLFISMLMLIHINEWNETKRTEKKKRKKHTPTENENKKQLKKYLRI